MKIKLKPTKNNKSNKLSKKPKDSNKNNKKYFQVHLILIQNKIQFSKVAKRAYCIVLNLRALLKALNVEFNAHIKAHKFLKHNLVRLSHLKLKYYLKANKKYHSTTINKTVVQNNKIYKEDYLLIFNKCLKIRSKCHSSSNYSSQVQI